MIRTTREAPFFGVWRDAARLSELAQPEFLTTARYEPILRRQIGAGHIDLLFESGDRSCILGGVLLDPTNLLLRERSAFVWPAHLAAAIDHTQLSAIERAIVPWLRALARGRAMAVESIRRLRPSERFERARAAGLLGAVPLGVSMKHLAPFVYARRFAANASVAIDCAHGALGYAALADVATCVQRIGRDDEDDAFVRAWYGVDAPQLQLMGKPDVMIADQRNDAHDCAIVVETQTVDPSLAVSVVAPAPVPWDILFSFDAADAPALTQFGVAVKEPPLRSWRQHASSPAFGGSAGRIVLALHPQTVAMHGSDVVEAEVFAQRLSAEGFAVHTVSQTNDPALTDAQLIHIFGAPYESHTIAFAEFARQRGIDYIFDIPPTAGERSSTMEDTLFALLRSSMDDAEQLRYYTGFVERRLQASPDPNGPPEPNEPEMSGLTARFAQLVANALGVLAIEEDIDGLRATLPAAVAASVLERGTFIAPEPEPERIGHIVPSAEFALVHAPLARQTHVLCAAVAAERAAIPIVVTGPVYDVEFLGLLRSVAPNAIVLADPKPGLISALYRRAALWVDAGQKPRSVAPFLRAVACGALPVLGSASPLLRLAGNATPAFEVRSLEACGHAMREALAFPDRAARMSALGARLSARSDPARAFGGVMAAYARAAAPV